VHDVSHQEKFASGAGVAVGEGVGLGVAVAVGTGLGVGVGAIVGTGVGVTVGFGAACPRKKYSVPKKIIAISANTSKVITIIKAVLFCFFTGGGVSPGCGG
jgi:hypothetical protein